MSKLTVDIVEEFIESITLSGDVISFSDDGVNTTINVASTYHGRKGMLLDIDGSDYIVLGVLFDNSFIVEGVLPSPTMYTVPNPFYFHGTPIMTDSHIVNIDHDSKVPMIYLAEILRETELPEDSAILLESELRLFFLDESDKDNWSTDEHYSNRIKGLSSLVDAFIAAARSYGKFYLYETRFRRINHANWGKFVDLKGHIKSIFADDLSGVEVSFTLPIRKCC